jgi:hypothetical protein
LLELETLEDELPAVPTEEELRCVPLELLELPLGSLTEEDEFSVSPPLTSPQERVRAVASSKAASFAREE